MTDDVRNKLLADIDKHISECECCKSTLKTNAEHYEKCIAEYEGKAGLYRKSLHEVSEEMADIDRQIRELEEAKKEL